MVHQDRHMVLHMEEPLVQITYMREMDKVIIEKFEDEILLR